MESGRELYAQKPSVKVESSIFCSKKHFIHSYWIYSHACRYKSDDRGEGEEPDFGLSDNKPPILLQSSNRSGPSSPELFHDWREKERKLRVNFSTMKRFEGPIGVSVALFSSKCMMSIERGEWKWEFALHLTINSAFQAMKTQRI